MAGTNWVEGLVMPEDLALQQRIPQILATHTVRGMFMTSTLECLRRAKGEEATRKAAADAGFAGASWGAMKKVPLSDFNKLRTIVAHALLPEPSTIERAVAKVAGAAVEIFFESVAGRTMNLLAGSDPHRLMGAAPNGYALAVDDGASRNYEKVDIKAGRFTFTGDRLGPCHQYGVFFTAVKTVCSVELDVRIEQTSLLDFKFHVSWT